MGVRYINGGGNVTAALKAAEQQARHAVHDSSVIAAFIRNACALLA